MSGAERREFIRIGLEIPVRYKYISRKGIMVGVTDRIYEGTTRDVSAGGLCLNAKIPDISYLETLLTGQVAMALNWELPRAGILKATAKVSWVGSFSENSVSIPLGLNFEEIDEEMRSAIFRFVAQYHGGM